MPPQQQNRLTIQQAQNLLTTRQISSQELTQSCLDRHSSHRKLHPLLHHPNPRTKP